MGVVDKALWLIETNLHGPLTPAFNGMSGNGGSELWIPVR